MDDSSTFGPAPNVFPAAVYPTRGEARERSTVLLAKGIVHWVADAPGGFALCVEERDLREARVQLEAYDAEQREVAAGGVRAELPRHAAGWKGLIVAAVVLACVFQWQQTSGGAVDQMWCRDSVAIFEHGEWWRTATALLLHQDIAHLAGNLLFGAIFGVFVARAVGPWLGWSMVIASGILGNALTAWLWHPNPYRGIGASTAVFGAVGILVARGIFEARRQRGLRHHRAWLLPLGGGLALLGLFGSGGESAGVDLAAHLLGFAAGLPLGFAASLWQENFATRPASFR